MESQGTGGSRREVSSGTEDSVRQEDVQLEDPEFHGDSEQQRTKRAGLVRKAQNAAPDLQWLTPPHRAASPAMPPARGGPSAALTPSHHPLSSRHTAGTTLTAGRQVSEFRSCLERERLLPQKGERSWMTSTRTSIRNRATQPPPRPGDSQQGHFQRVRQCNGGQHLSSKA